jgi:hypothetical protein
VKRGSPTSGTTATEAVRGEWLRRVEAEYRSAALTQHLGHWLLQAGASPDLVGSTLRIVGDELTHSELSHLVYRAAGGTGSPRIDRTGLELRRTPVVPLEHDLVLVAVEMFCLGETAAVRLFSRMRSGCDVPPARRALDRILRDEVFHRDFGWTLLEWMLELPDAPMYRSIVEARLPAMIEGLRRNYVVDDAGPPGITGAAEADRRWGLIPFALYREAIDETLARDLRPRFAELRIACPADGAVR